MPGRFVTRRTIPEAGLRFENKNKHNGQEFI